jgi:outer membrane protein assembly factor BamA
VVLVDGSTTLAADAYARVRWVCRRARTPALGVVLAFLAAAPAQAQQAAGELAAATADTTRARTSDAEEGEASVWRLVVDGKREAWSDAPALPLDSLRRAAQAAVRHVQQRGHYRARLDSAVVDSSASGPPQAALYVHAGPQVAVGRVTFTGNRALSGRTLRALMDTRPGRRLRPERLEGDVNAILRRYEEEGFPLAQVRVAGVRFEGAPPTLALTLAVDEGAALRLSRVQAEEEGRTHSRFLTRAAGLEPGAPLDGYDPAVLRERLRETQLFESVGEPELLLEPAEREGEQSAVVRVPVGEKPPATFDLALGYLPPSGGKGGRLVGSGSLALRSPFGGGRTASVKLDRRPGAVSRFEASAAAPFFLGTPLQIGLGFDGLQEDSTYARQRYEASVGYRLGDGLTVRAHASREVTRPGIAGSRLARKGRTSNSTSNSNGSNGDGRLRRQRVARATSLFGGGGVRLRRLRGSTASPRGGVSLRLDAAFGRKSRSARRVTAAGDTTRRERTLAQQRVEGRARAYVALFRRQVVAVGADAAVLLADRYDRSDLFFLGGAGSLRGYDEDRFRGHAVGRALAEYRYLLGRRAFAFAFADLGYARRPELPGASQPQGGWHPGFGAGVQFESALGLVNLNYALNDEDRLTGGRIHLGLAVGL